jgi:hypothetical protein
MGLLPDATSHFRSWLHLMVRRFGSGGDTNATTDRFPPDGTSPTLADARDQHEEAERAAHGDEPLTLVRSDKMAPDSTLSALVPARHDRVARMADLRASGVSRTARRRWIG